MHPIDLEAWGADLEVYICNKYSDQFYGHCSLRTNGLKDKIPISSPKVQSFYSLAPAYLLPMSSPGSELLLVSSPCLYAPPCPFTSHALSSFLTDQFLFILQDPAQMSVSLWSHPWVWQGAFFTPSCLPTWALSVCRTPRGRPHIGQSPETPSWWSYWSTSLSLLEILVVNCQYKDYFFARKTELFCYFGACSTWKLELGFWEKGEHNGNLVTQEWRSSHSRWRLEDHLPSLSVRSIYNKP